MADLLDQADTNIEFALKHALHASRKPEPSVQATGECLFCGEPVDEGRRWCDAECRDYWEAENP